MNCGFDRELLSVYADGALELERVVDVEAHLAECEECRMVLREMRAIGVALTSLPRNAAPRELIERILEEADGKGHQSAWDALRWTVGAVWTTAMDGFKIEDDRQELLRRESPIWIARWVLYV